MGLIQLKEITNPLHRELIKEYASKLGNTPLKTKFHRLPTHDLIESALDPKYDLSKFIYPDLVYRYYFDSNFSILIFGSRSDYKSSCATQFALWALEIAGIKEPDEFDFVVDSDSELVKWYQKDNLPAFTTLIKDEWDKKQSGIGVGTMSETLRNVINRIRGRRINLIICTPEFSPYPVDYFFRTWEYIRYGKRVVQLLVYDEDQNLKGHCFLPMPTDPQIDKYQKRKSVFLKRTQTMAFTLDQALIQIAEDVITDPTFPQLSYDAKGKPSNKNRTARITYIAMKYQADMQSEALKKRVEELATFLQTSNLKKFPTSSIQVKS